ncbi:MAG: nitrilase-related carbon-nitrogen hydrolase [bacterium]
MKTVLVQNNPIFGEKEKNTEALFSMMKEKEGDIYILPELAFTGYQFRDKDELISLSDETNSPFTNVFAEKSKELNAAIVFGFAENDGSDRVYNSSMMVTPEGDRYIYRKTHLFYKEKELFMPGNTGFNVFDFRGAKIGLAVCFDWIFPESFRTLALKGAHIIAHSSNLVMPYCQKADYARAVENRVFVCTANRIGIENRTGEQLTFTGGSVCVSPQGDYLAEMPLEEESVEMVDIDIEKACEKDINPFNNVFSDRRPGIYESSF